MASARPTAIVVFIFFLVCGDARVETRLAAGFNRRNRDLKGASSIWNGTLTSAALCLSACVKLNCQSLTYGRRECALYATYLCHPQDRFRLSLVSAPGITYFDLNGDQPQVDTFGKKEACQVYGRCVETCEEGSWIAPPSRDKNGEFEGSLPNPASSEHGSSSKLSEQHSSASSTSKGQTTTNHQKSSQNSSRFSETGNSRIKVNSNLADSASESSGKGGGNRFDTSTEIGGNTPTATSPGPTLPPEKLDAGLLLMQAPKAFDEALEHCIKLNMSLAMPETKDEHVILVEAMRHRGIARMWIGVKKVTEGGIDATYVDGRAVSRQLLLWGEGQPNNSRGGQICVEMNAILKYLWNDFDCLYKAAFVCR